MGKVVIMVGCPGSGKSTYIKNKFSDALIVSADHFFMNNGVYEFDRNLLGRAHGECYQNFMEAITAGIELVVVDNTNTTMREINTYANPAREKGYDVEVVVLSVDPQIGYSRNVHGVPFDTIQKMANRITNTVKILTNGTVPWVTTVINQ